WVFQRPHVQKNRVQDLAGKNSATIEGSIRLITAQSHQALVLDGKSNRVTISDDHTKTTQPVRAMTAESWVRIEAPRRWGGIIGAIQDNGAYERGWLLGYCNSSFCFALAGKEGPSNMTYLTASEAFIPGQWYHVAATYDGKTQSLYVNGKLLGTSRAEQGDINYPPKAFYEIGSYHDSDENYPAQGMIHEVRLYKRALTAAEIMQNFESKQLKTSPTAELAAGPYLRFTGPDEATVHWETHEAVPTELTYGQDDDLQTVSTPTLTRTHQARLSNLKRHRRYHYSIQVRTNTGSTSTSQFECDTYFNFNILPAHATSRPTGRAAEILAKTPFKRGLCLVIGSGDGTLMQELAEQSQLHIIGFTTDPAEAAAARQLLQANGLYGTRAAVSLVTSLDAIPVTRCGANLITSQDLLDEKWEPTSLAEIHRLLQPRGVAVLGLSDSDGPGTIPEDWLSWLKQNGIPAGSTASATTRWLHLERKPLDGAGSWSHLYGSADNSAFGGESLQDAKSTSDLVVQWIGRPGPRYQPDRNGRKPSPLSVNGRLFLQGLQRLVALDAYNGTVLWSLEIPSLGRFNMPRDCGNWTADDNFVYVAINDRLWHIDAATGEVLRMQKVPSGPTQDWSHDWGYIANIEDSILGSTVKKGSSFKSFWGGASDGWYDAKTGKATAKVCSEQLFSLRKSDASQRWLYRGGIILNSTITATEKTIYFVENRHPAIRESKERRITAPELWKDNHLVALDFKTG
ncbi:MAG: methyltransferase domain-containing protein, partial [Pirellulaceae bacterium]|nr:methyltransferase domain-containing protein [Pirellulaceae bacterium]